MVKLFHFSPKPIRKVTQRKYYQFNRVPWDRLPPVIQRKRPPGKPYGFWVSCGEDWKRWCKSEEYGLNRLKYKYQVHLKKKDNLLRITTLEQLDDFSEKYGFDPFNNAYSYNPDIRWNLVYPKYQGVLIFPYFQDRRLHNATHWYYGWDCASGVIWDVSCIDRIELVRKSTVPKKKGAPACAQLIEVSV